MLNKRIRHFLDSHHIHYDTVKCKAKDIKEKAAAAKIPEKGLAKTTIVKVDGKWAMLVEPLTSKTALADWKKLLGCREIALASDDELEDFFRDYEKDSIPGFGNLWDMDVYLDDKLGGFGGDEIAFNSGSPTELIKLDWNDYVKWVRPKLFHLH